MEFQKLIVVLFAFTISSSVGQITIKGKVVNRDTREPVVYANIGIANSNAGTISNPDGSFEILIPKQFLKDKIFFSALGFGKRTIPIELLRKESIVYLWEMPALLNEVSVQERKEKNKIFELGNPASRGGVMETDTLYSGRSVALLIENANPKSELKFPVYVEKARLRIYRNNLKSFKFRVRFNEVDSLTGAPGNDMMQQSIVVTSSMRNGWLEFDLSNKRFVVTKPFYVTFEQILDRADRMAIARGYQMFKKQHPNKVKHDTVVFEGKKEVHEIFKGGGIDLPGTFIGIASIKRYSCFVRETSFGNWNKVRGIVTATVTLSNQPAAAGKQNKTTLCTDQSVDCRIENSCQEFLNETGMNGAQLCISVGGKIRFSKSFGLADVENRIPVTDSTKFRINSISKSVTSLALIKLVADGKLDLDAAVQKYLPDFPIKKYPFTTRQLAGHLAGFRDYYDVKDLVHTEHYENATQALKVFERDTLLFKPGSKFYYSTFGWNLIGAIIESVSHQSYLNYMRENIWSPLKLNSMCGDDVMEVISNRSKFYDAVGEANDFGDISYKYAGGGLLSTTIDLVKIGNQLLYGNYYNPVLKKTFFESQKTLDGKESGYGLGWYVGKDRNGHRMWYHSGDGFSSSSHLYIYPDDDLVISFLGNGQEGAAFDVQKIAEMIYKK